MKTPSETSPYQLMQEEFRNDPWKLLVACICLNQCAAKTARPVWKRIFEKWSTPGHLLDDVDQFGTVAVQSTLETILRPIGFQNRRAERIVRMTEDLNYQFRNCDWDRFRIEPLDLYGIGKYGADSYNMFVKGELLEDVQDKELKNYVAWAKEKHGREAGPSPG